MLNPNSNNKDNNNRRRNLGLIAGVLVMGLVAASIAGGQALSATAQENPDDEPMPVDIGCPTGAEICGNQIVEAEHKNAGPATVSTSGTATTKVQPDKVSVTVGVQTNGTTAQEAASSNAALADQVVAALRALGISEEQISTSSYNVYPVYSHSEPVNACMVPEGQPVPPECYVRGEEVTGYRASNSVTVILDVEGSDVDASEVIDAAIEAGANNVNGVYFFLSSERQEEVRDSLIGDAIANSRHRADVAAEAVEMTVSGIKSIDLNDTYFPIFNRGFDGAALESGADIAATPILPGEQEVSMTVNTVFYMSGAAQGEEEEGEEEEGEEQQ
jgi:uncharacterized protein